MTATMFVGAASADAGTVKIGMSGPLTGGAAIYGQAVKNAEELAVKEINAANGSDVFEWKFEDDEHDAEKSVNAYNTLKDWGMQVMAGQVTTGSALAVAPESTADNMFNLTPSASAESLALSGHNVFQMCFTDPNQGASAAELVSTKFAGSKVGIIYDSSDDYSTGLYNGFSTNASKLGVEIVATTSYTADNKADLSTQVTQCQDAGADLVFLPIYYTEASQILTYANRIGYAPKFFGCDGMDGILAIEGFDTSLAEGLMLLTPFSATVPETKSFVDAYVAANGVQPNQFAADAYDGVYIVKEALEKAGCTADMSSADICEALVAQMTQISYSGLTGKDMTWNAIYSVLFSLIAIGLYITFRFKRWQWASGATLALAVNALFIIGLFSMLYGFVPFNLEVNQAFIAAILTIIGYAINDTVVVFDRIREYLGLYPKRNLKDNVNNAINSTLSRTINTSGTTLVTLLAIFFFGGETIRGFIFALTVGVIVGTVATIFIATPVAYDLMAKRAKIDKE